MNQTNLMIIGVGFHARRIYIPRFIEIGRNASVRLVAGVDIESQRSAIGAYLRQKELDLEMFYVKPLKSSGSLSSDSERALDSIAHRFNIRGVVISTEPLAHVAYAAWALKRGLHILMDKPISARVSASTDSNQAQGLVKDYKRLLSLYHKSCKIRPTIFSINVQRRYDYGFDKVKGFIAEARDRFNVPVTSIQAMHADGTWVFPKEILSQESHPYFNGYGKCSHSGYHIFDMAWQLYESGTVVEKRPDTLQAYASFLSPRGFGIDISENDYRSYFGASYESTGLGNKEYLRHVRRYGEIDAFGIFRLLRRRENICNISVNLLHSSFSQRSWAAPGEDLYKGNGRVKHQQFTIQQGPFQCVQIHNYQSLDRHDVDNSGQFEVGGNNHFDILVFRNVRMFGSGEPLMRISANELELELDGRLSLEKAKDRVIIEFVDFIQGKLRIKDLKSNIDTQLMPVLMMSGMYLSNARMHKGMNPLVTMLIPNSKNQRGFIKGNV